MNSEQFKFIAIGTVGILALLLLFSVGVLTAQGFTLSRLWGWFVVPLGASSVGVAQAVGLLLVYRHLKGGKSSDEDDLKKQMAKFDEMTTGELLWESLTPFFVCGGFLAVGWVVSQFL